jgi:serine/threonine protein phosphatase 1
MIAIGDYLFVHAGVSPTVPFGEQRTTDLRWIREPFLSHSEPFGAVVVHGHTITDEPQDRGNRIGIDTGAYLSGRLTALVLEGTRRRFLTVSDEDGSVSAAARELAA